MNKCMPNLYLLLAKGVSKKSGKVICGNPLLYMDRTEAVLEDNEEAKALHSLHTIAKIQYYGDSDWGMYRTVSVDDVYPNTICKTTGLFSSKGTRGWVFEHDVFRDSSDREWEVLWKEYDARFILNSGQETIPLNKDTLDSMVERTRNTATKETSIDGTFRIKEGETFE